MATDKPSATAHPPGFKPGFKPYDFPRNPEIAHPTLAQRHMVRFQVLNRRAFNLSDMGTMKTLATLWAADWLMQSVAPLPMRAIIVTTLSTTEEIWAQAVFKNFFGRRTFAILHGSEEKRIKELAKPVDFYIVNYDGVKVGAKFVDQLRADGTPRGFRKLVLNGFALELQKKKDIQIVIIDEASAYKAANRNRHKVFTRIFEDRAYMWALTGTPTPNGPPDAYGIAKLLGKHNGETFTSFHNRTMQQISQYKWEPRADGYDAARSLLQPAIRFDIKDIWDGPPCTTQRRQIELTSEQCKMIQDLKTDFVTYVRTTRDAVTIVAENAAAVRTKVLQVSLGAIYDQDHKAHRLDNSPRYQELIQVIENTRQKILIFSPFTSVVDFLYENLRKGYSVEKVTGATTPKNRSLIFRAFQNAVDPRIIVADPGTMAHGVELFAASASIWYGPTDKNELYEQANKRSHRPGQQHPVTVVQFVATRIEREIFDRLEKKQNLQGLMLRAVREDWAWI
jgi:SNF2 family DNA or RNA helicase